MRATRDYSVDLWLTERSSTTTENCVELSYIARAVEVAEIIELIFRDPALLEELKVMRVFEMNVQEVALSSESEADIAKIVRGPFRQKLMQIKREGVLKRLLRR